MTAWKKQHHQHHGWLCTTWVTPHNYLKIQVWWKLIPLPFPVGNQTTSHVPRFPAATENLELDLLLSILLHLWPGPNMLSTILFSGLRHSEASLLRSGAAYADTLNRCWANLIPTEGKNLHTCTNPPSARFHNSFSRLVIQVIKWEMIKSHTKRCHELSEDSSSCESLFTG